MLIDKYLKHFDFNEIHDIFVHEKPQQVYRVVKGLNLRDSSIVRLLFSIRGLPGGALMDLTRIGFILLDESPGKELVLGLVTQPWKYRPELLKVHPEEFHTFNENGYVKVAWNICLSECEDKNTRVYTETRVYCTNDEARRKFSLYWLFIAPFSGLIRVIMLNLIRRESETQR
jgi:hypothetical protein